MATESKKTKEEVDLKQQALREVRGSIIDDAELDQVVLRLKSCEGDVFKINPAVTQASKFLRAKLNDVGREDEIELETVSTVILLKVIAFMQNHDDARPMPQIELPITSGSLVECGLNKWHQKYMQLDSLMLLDLISASDVFIIRPLHELIIAKLASRLYDNAGNAKNSPKMLKGTLPLKALFLLLSEGIPYLQSRERCNAMYVLRVSVPPNLEPESRAEAVRLVGKRLGDPDETVRATALEVLPAVCVQGSDDSFYAVAEWLEDRDSRVRCFAIKAFAIVADKGSERSIARVTTCVRATNPDARKTALPVLFTVCSDAAQAIHIIGETLEHEEEEIRNYASGVLLDLVKKKEHREIVIHVVHTRLMHANSHVRICALQTYSQMCAKGDENVNAIIREMLVDPIDKVRQVAVDALAHVTDKDCPENLAICGTLLAHEDEGIRQTALQLFLINAQPGSEAQYSQVLPLMFHKDDAVRRIGLGALSQSLARGKDEDMASLINRVEHQLQKVREAVTEVLARVAEKGTDQGIGADAVDRPRVEHPGYGLLAEAANTFALIAEQGARHGLAMLSERVEYNDECTREAVVMALIEVAEWGHERSLRAVCFLMEDQIQQVIHKLTRVFTELADCGADRLFEAVMHGLEHYDLRIRRAAAMQAVSAFQMHGLENCMAELLSVVKAQIMKVREAMVDALANQLEKGSENVISLVTERLENEDAGVRIAAIRNMSRIITHKDESFAVREACRRLENCRAEVRSDAIKALLEIRTVGCERTIQELMKRLEHPDANVRRSATEAMPQVAGIDSPFTIDAVCALLDHQYVYVRETACECLDVVATKGNEQAIKAVAAFMDHEEQEVRDIAVVALTKVSYVDDVCAAVEVLQRLQAKEEYIVIAALSALPLVLSKDQETAVAWVIECLADVHEEVREMAHKVLPGVASRGNLAAITGIGALFGHKSKRVQKLAAQCIFEVSDVGSPVAITAVCVHLAHNDDDVRHLVVSNLAKISGKGNPHAFQEIVIHTENRFKGVVVSALQAILETSEVGDPNAIAAVGRCLEHGNPDVRKQAGDCFEYLVPKGNEQALQILQPFFNYKNMKVVVTALDALGRVAGRGHSEAWAITNRFLSPPHDKGLVRKAAVIAMGRICEIQNDEKTELVFVSRLGDLDPEVKETAVEWLDIYRGKKPPPSTMGRKLTFRGAAQASIASRRMSSRVQT